MRGASLQRMRGPFRQEYDGSFADNAIGEMVLVGRLVC